jgi:hypothetical protein
VPYVPTGCISGAALRVTSVVCYYSIRVEARPCVRTRTLTGVEVTAQALAAIVTRGHLARCETYQISYLLDGPNEPRAAARMAGAKPRTRAEMRYHFSRPA